MAISTSPGLASSTSFSRATINLHASDQSSSGIRTLPELIEYNAKQNPDHPFCVQATKQTGASSYDFLTVTHLQFKQAILRCSAWLVANIAELELPYKRDDVKVVKGPPVALFMESDVGLLIFKLSLISLGVPVLLLSARLSPTAVHHLLIETGTRAIVVSPRLHHTAKEGLSLFPVPGDSPKLYSQITYGSFLKDSNHDDHYVQGNICGTYHYIGEFDRSALILHSSGTTGLPKPIYTSHKHLLCFTVCHNLSSDEEAHGLNMSTLPLYHGFGLVTPYLSLGVGKTFFLLPPSIVPTGVSTVELLKATNARSLMSVPSILEDISLLPENEGIAALIPLQFVAFGGGLLKPIVGEKLAAAGVRLLNHYGTTETGPLAPIFVPTPDYDYRYFRLRKDMDLNLEPVATPEDGVQRYRLIVRPFGWGTTFEVQDQLVSNPRHPLTDFNAIGRNDDMIVLATGEKVIPRILESMLSESELVKAAIAFGEGQFEPGVIVQSVLPLLPEEHEHFKDSIWPTILQAGNQMDAHARITSKHAIIVVPPGVSIPRSDKGSVMRKEVYKVFQEEIATTYRNLDNSTTDDSLSALRIDHLEQDIKDLIQLHLNWRVPAEEWSFDDDLFELGMDSLQAVQLRRFILSSLPRTAQHLLPTERVNREFVYQHPSVTAIADALRGTEGSNGLTNGVTTDRKARINRFVELYSIQRPDSSGRLHEGSVVLLTGSTGSLGSYLLAHLANLPTVTRVISLIRPRPDAGAAQDPYQRQVHSAKAKGIEFSQGAWSKIQVIQTNLAAPLLGLDDADYAYLREEVTHIIHNAWPMDFKMGLSSFKTQFQSLQNLLNLAREAHAVRPLVRPRFLFVSSIAVVGQYELVHRGRIVPEIPMSDDECTNPIGYGEAKLVCERIIENAAQLYSKEIEASYVRIGQMSGSTTSGFWNKEEHLAAMIKSSQKIGRLPSLEGTLSWVPVDKAAEVLSDLLLTTHPSDLVYHLENPVRQSWHDALAVLASSLNLSNVEFLPFEEWLDRVCATADDENPAKNLVEFFKVDFKRMSSGSVVLGTERARQVSPTLRYMDTVSKESIAAYIDYWRSIGFLK